MVLLPMLIGRFFVYIAILFRGVNSMFFQLFAIFSWRFQRKIVNLPSDINYLNILPWVNILTPSPIGASNASSDKNSARTC